MDTQYAMVSQVPEKILDKRTSTNDELRLFVGLQSKGALLQSGLYFFPVEEKRLKVLTSKN
jgi:hypothetical protein